MKLLPLLLGVVILVLTKESEETGVKSKRDSDPLLNGEGETEEQSLANKLKTVGKEIKGYFKSTVYNLIDWAAKKLKPKT